MTTKLRSGFTTGACAAAAAKAAVLTLCGKRKVKTAEIPFPDGTRTRMPVLFTKPAGSGCKAAVRKFAGDDPDVTDGAVVVTTVTFEPGGDVAFVAGKGVGIVTKPGLQIPPGQPAINPGPRQMICDAVREATSRGVRITISIPGGRKLAMRTFNPRLGVEGGLSILGTTGRVRPFSVPALRDALACSLDVAMACGVRAPVLVPGHIGERAARRHFSLTADQVIHVGNEWGFMLDRVADGKWDHVLIVGHPGKLAKLAQGHWDTHSNRSEMAIGAVVQLAARLGIVADPHAQTVEGLFESLKGKAKRRLGDALAEAVRTAVRARIPQPLAVALVNMKGDLLGTNGDISPWQ